MKSIDNKSSLQVDRNPSLSLQTNGTEKFSTKKILNMTSRDQGLILNHLIKRYNLRKNP